MLEGTRLHLGAHRKQVQQASLKGRKARVLLESKFADGRAQRIGVREKWRLLRAKSAGIWLACVPNRLNETELSAEEFRDNLRLRYNLHPLFMPE